MTNLADRTGGRAAPALCGRMFVFPVQAGGQGYDWLNEGRSAKEHTADAANTDGRTVIMFEQQSEGTRGHRIMKHMASFGTYVTNFVKTAFYTILPNKVDEYSYEHYVSEYFTLEKVETLYSCFIFYKVANHYDMIYVPPAASLDTLSKDRRVYSLFRFQGDVKVGLEFFKHYADVIAILADINSKHETKLDRVWLEKITGLCRRYSTWTAAHVAASLNFLPAFQDQRVISLINKIDSETGWTPLFVAVKAGSVEAVKAIMAVKDFRQGIVDSEANSVLHVASSLASAEILEILLDIAPKVDGALPSNGTQRLPTGNRNNERATVNAVNANGETALHIACSTPSPQCVEALLKAGATPLIGTADLYPIHIAIEKESTECVNLLCEYCPGGINLQTRKMKLSVLHLAKQKPQLFDHLCDLGVELNLRNSSGQTILHEAVREQNLDRVLALLMLGASTVIGDSAGAHPLHYAVEPKNPDVHIIYALLAFEADPNAEDSNGHTARHWLCRHESGTYQHSITRDTALYALDAVRARRCPIDREQCTAGCIAVESIASGQRRPTPSMQQSMSLSFLFQMMQEKMGSGCSSDPDTATETPNEATLLENELIFNGTPPAPVLNASLLKDDRRRAHSRLAVQQTVDIVGYDGRTVTNVSFPIA
nr:unnamed protein product [Spirometra erinaceieuropaei]